jgi:hypothetical protein
MTKKCTKPVVNDLVDALEASIGVVDWAGDHGANKQAVTAIKRMAKKAIARGKRSCR